MIRPYYDTNCYWAIRGSLVEREANLAEMPREQLAGIIIDGEYNRFLSEHADFPLDGLEVDERGHGKRIPYIGWYWRHIQFSQRDVPIGNCGDFVGFMANNKWDYEGRNLTDAEFDGLMLVIDEAMRLDREGGIASETQALVHAKLAEIWDYLASVWREIPVPERDSDRNPEGEDPKGLSAKHESAVPSGNRPENPAKSIFGEPLND
jgi:hypothetical protein